MANQALYLERGAITSHMGGRSVGVVTLHSIRMLLSMYHHLSSMLTTRLVSGGGAATYGGIGMNCTIV